MGSETHSVGLRHSILVRYVPWRAVDKYFRYPRVHPGIRTLRQEHALRGDLVVIPGGRFPGYMAGSVSV